MEAPSSRPRTHARAVDARGQGLAICMHGRAACLPIQRLVALPNMCRGALLLARVVTFKACLNTFCKYQVRAAFKCAVVNPNLLHCNARWHATGRECSLAWVSSRPCMHCCTMHACCMLVMLRLCIIYLHCLPSSAYVAGLLWCILTLCVHSGCYACCVLLTTMLLGMACW